MEPLSPEEEEALAARLDVLREKSADFLDWVDKDGFTPDGDEAWSAIQVIESAAGALREPDGEALVREFAAWYSPYSSAYRNVEEGADRFLAARKETRDHE